MGFFMGGHEMKAKRKNRLSYCVVAYSLNSHGQVPMWDLKA
jgi:hypothetical protein